MLIADLYSKFPIIRKLTNMSSSTIINLLKGIFDEHGIPERLISDNGPQYCSKEFRVFSAKYGFDHVTSSPLYPMSNGFIERTVQTVKKHFIKAKEGGVDPHLAMLCLRTTPIHHKLPSPCELLNGRKYKSNLPAVSFRSDGNVNEFLQQRQVVYKSYHDRTAKELAPLSPQQTLRVLTPIRKTWDLAKVTNNASTPRSYNILTAQGTTYRRNRRHLRDTQEERKEQSSNDGTNDDLEDDRPAAHPGAIPQPESSVAISHTQRVEARRSSRVSKPPNRLDM